MNPLIKLRTEEVNKKNLALLLVCIQKKDFIFKILIQNKFTLKVHLNKQKIGMGKICSNASKKEMNFEPIINEDISYDKNSKKQQLMPLFGNFNNIQEYEFTSTNPSSFKQIRSKFQVVSLEEKENMYIFDGEILKMQNDQLSERDQVKQFSQKQKPELFKNLEQIKCFQQIENYGSNKQEYFKLESYWSGEKLYEVGGFYSKNGLKQGLWKETLKNFTIKAQLYFLGEYVNNKRVGKWRYIYKNKKIGGGFYNQLGQASGQWIEMSDSFCEESQILYYGYYNNGQKVSEWSILFRSEFEGQFKEVGGGLYDNRAQETSIKIGKWMELNDGFNGRSQVYYCGDYNSGFKIDRWDIYLNKDKRHQLIGGGLYKHLDRNTSIKDGKWIELSDGFWNQSQITYCGDYKNGKKVGKWDIYWKQGESNNKIGGGSYDELFKGISFKIGKWIELIDGFYSKAQVIFVGVYNQGKKIGKWNISWKQNGQNQYTNIGGGQYHKYQEDTVKVGQWIEMSEGFWDQSQITYCGNYKNDGKKMGRWDIYWKQGESNNKIGGGSYDDFVKGISIKNGDWIELSDSFQSNALVIFNGNYNYGRKVDKWDIYWNQVDQSSKIGGGSYGVQLNNSSIKIGQWTELGDAYSLDSQVYYKGEYRKGLKIGTWVINYQLKIIGGGSYDFGIKNGKWIELCEGFYKGDYGSKEITFNGEYSNGKKVGKWTDNKLKNQQLRIIYYD
ncbi:unnamed protein product [Paramecium sonneborni]|uniref:Uncharacterized protein n=1 Tax=Paramecium sonneborni TaxID=65129 RepID=A0A8S1QJ48_9CILI|nr:unnamed protein product [Paramecium sonneborni]